MTLFGACLCSSISLYAQERTTESIEISSELSHSVIYDIVQDHQGFIWVATLAGLNRFDGYDAKHFYSRRDGLSADEITALAVDSFGNIWVGTENGLNVYLQDKGIFQSFFHNPADNLSLASDKIYSLATADNGDLWIATEKGVSYYQSSTKSFKSFEILNELDIPSDNLEITAITSSDGITLLGTSSGQLALLQDNDTFKQVNSDDLNGAIKQIIKKSNKQFFVLTTNALYLWDNRAQKIELVEPSALGIDNQFIQFTSIAMASENELWLGSDKNGLYRANLDSGVSNLFFHRHTKDGYSGTNHINTLLQDKTGVLWIGTDANLHKINPSLINFKHYSQHSASELKLIGNSVFSVLVDSDGWYWFGTEFDGLSVFKPSSDGLKLDPKIQLPLLTSNSINTVLEGSMGIVWIVAADNVWTFDKNTGEFSLFRDTAFGDATFFIAKYHNGNLWIGSNYGLWRIDEDKKIKHFLIDQQVYNLQNKIINMEFDPNNEHIWLATEQGVTQFDIASETFTSLNEFIEDGPPGLSSVIYDLYLDMHGRLWVASYQYGLYQVDFATQKVATLNNSNSKLNNVIYSIQPDKKNNLWLATSQGLYRLEPDSKSLTHFNTIQDQPIRDFNLGAKFMDTKGKLLLAGINGVIHFDPKSYRRDESSASPVVLDVLINGQAARIGDTKDSHAKVPMHVTDELKLFHDDTSLSIAFAAMHFANPDNNRFKYMLEGYDKNWIEVDAEGRRAIYGKLDSGDYTFKLMASNKDGVWGEEIKSIRVEVLPSPYFSNLALMLYALIFGSLMAVSFALYRSRINERKAASERLAESEERLKLSLWGSGDELWDWDIKTGALHLSNEWDIDFPRDGIRSGHSDANSNIHPNDLPFVKQSLQAHLSGKSKHFESTYRLSNEKGGWVWVLDQGKSVEFDDDKRPSRMAGTLKNVSEIKDAEQRLSVIAKSFENISDGVWILDSDLKYIAINKSFETITGYPSEQVIGAHMQENAIKDMNENFYQRLMALLEEKGSWQGELEAIRKDGTVYPIDINVDVVRDSDNNIINYVGVFSDITYRKIAEKELRRLATTDQLTSLLNRNTFRTEIETTLAHSAEGVLHALLFIDLDNFKRINDSLGHSAGDELLVAVAEHLQDVMKENNGIVARLGGDEFIIFLQDVDAWNQAAQVAQDVLDRFTEKLEFSNNKLMVSPSIGIVMYPENGSTADELLRNADTAMYYAKKKGKNTFQFYTRQMNEQAKLRLNLENDLRAAIEKDEFVVFYQPKVSLQTGTIEGFEALIRWRNEKRGLVMPNEFIPLAEESGLIIPISQQVIEKACIQVRDWQKRDLFHGKMAINLSAIQFYHENLWETVKNALHLANLEAESIEFEITEGMVMQDLAHSIQQMNTLKDMGVSLALDDFGVGYSSLGNLKDFPIDTLKIDRSFVWDLDDSERDKKLVASIVTLAHNLDIKVVAEGVETIKQVEALKEMKCEEIQGFIFSRPLPAFEIERLLEDSNATLERALLEAREDQAD